MESPPSTASSPRKRANTTQVAGIPSIPEARPIDADSELFGSDSKADVFENRDDDGKEASEPDTPAPELNLPGTLDDLPIEIRSMTERFLESLSAKVHPAPLSADTLSDMFQDFYERAASQISVHIATLASRLGRKETSPAATVRNAKGRARAGSSAKRNGSPASTTSGGEMLTVSEVSDRKKARKILELKRLAWEEAVERAVCEKIYDKLWKHRTTDDDARDEKLRSRTAALSLVGIGLKELHVDIEPSKGPVPKTAQEQETEIYTSLSAAREALLRMDDERCPLGKLQHLTAAHKSIVETLSQLFPSSSSADEILPTLIYTLITAADLDLNVVSNLSFIQRFRSSSKVDGESAYCLVNLEAAISFLETVDLSSLRADEPPEGPAKINSRPSTPNTSDKAAPHQPHATHTLKPETSSVTATSHDIATPSTTDKPLPAITSANLTTGRPGAPSRRLSSMVQAQADRFETSRNELLQAADKVYDSINGTLENSLNSLFGRLKDQVTPGSTAVTLPKTLEEARKLVSTPPPTDDDTLALSGSGRSSPDDPLSEVTNPKSTNSSSNRPLELLAGRGPNRDRSVDSASSTTSSLRRKTQPTLTTNSKAPTESSSNNNNEPLAAASNFISSMNPLSLGNRFTSNFSNAIPRFGRAASTGTPPPPQNHQQNPQPPSLDTSTKPKHLSHITESPTTTVTPATPTIGSNSTNSTSQPSHPPLERTNSHVSDDLNATEALAELRRIKPPRKRFLEVGSANELRLGEVEELLAEYRRLARAIGEAVA